jgi:hypothetical protein
MSSSEDLFGEQQTIDETELELTAYENEQAFKKLGVELEKRKRWLEMIIEGFKILEMGEDKPNAIKLRKQTVAIIKCCNKNDVLKLDEVVIKHPDMRYNSNILLAQLAHVLKGDFATHYEINPTDSSYTDLSSLTSASSDYST